MYIYAYCGVHKAARNTARIVQDQPGSKEIGYQHSALSQVYLPYKRLTSPLDTTREVWDRTYGPYRVIMVNSGLGVPGEKACFAGIPYGTKARLVLSYIHRQGIMRQSPFIDIKDSFTEFVEHVESLRGVRDFRPNGPVMAEYKDQLMRFSTSMFTLGYESLHNGSDPVYVNQVFFFVTSYRLWIDIKDGKKLPWPSELELETKYFESILQHGLPLDDRAIASLSHSSMAMDIYTWLAHRLHRIEPNKPQFVSWKNLYDQFGYGYTRIRKFKEHFRKQINQVLWQYPDARSRVSEDHNKGYWLRHTPPPVAIK